MKVPLTIIALSTLTWLPHVLPQKITIDNYNAAENNHARRVTRDTSADQMVHNILHWLEGIEADSNRRVRQNELRSYLPPNSQRPRPFQPTPPEENTIAGMLPPESQFPSEVTSEPQYPGIPQDTPSPEPGPNEISFPVEHSETPGQQQPEEQSTPGDGTVIGGYISPEGTPQPPFVSPPETSEVPGDGESVGYPPAGQTPQPPFPPIESEIATPSPPLSGEPVSPEGTPYPPSGETPQPPFVDVEIPGDRETQSPEGVPPQSESTSPPQEVPSDTVDVTGYPPALPGVTETQPEVPGGPSEEPTSGPPQAEESGTTSTFPPILRQTEEPSPSESSSPPEQQPTITETQPSLPEVNGSQPSEPEPTGTGDTPSLPEVNVVEPTPEAPSPPAEDDSSHPPHVHAIDVQCAKEMMTITIEFNRPFDGIIYSKGFYSNPDCRYVNENSGQTTYNISLRLDSCGTQFVNAFDTENQSYLENVLVIQNEAGIQEVWDVVRSVRCLWEGSLSKSLTISLSVSMLSEEIVTFSGDTAVARLDIQRGEGPFAPSATGLVPIGEKMTLVVSVTGDPGFDIQVKDCKAKDEDGGLEYALTDEDGCVLRPKLFGAFQKTRNTGNTDASIIAYAFFSAFKFPDVMDLMIECNVELCKTDCDVCPNPDQKIQPGKRRRRRDAFNETIGEPVKIGKLLRVLLPEDLSDGEKLVEIEGGKEFCMSFANFLVSFVILISFLLCSACFCFYMYLKRRTVAYKHQF